MRDGSDAVADWPLLNALLNCASGATWVSIHQGGGVGIGFSQHAGMVIVCDGTDDAARRIARVLERPGEWCHAPRRRRLRAGAGLRPRTSARPSGHTELTRRMAETVPSPDHLFLETALLPSGWARDVLIGYDGAGLITSVTTDAAPPASAERLRGIALPGVPNLHSHAPQRAIAGLGERSGSGTDSFWSWREAMYRAVARTGPDELQAIATQLYVEMLQAGYTTVAEFHYLHHDLDGRPYADPAEMSHRLIVSARIAGIRLTLLPVLYVTGGFGGAAPVTGQRRFLHDLPGFQRLVQQLRDDAAGYAGSDRWGGAAFAAGGESGSAGRAGGCDANRTNPYPCRRTAAGGRGMPGRSPASAGGAAVGDGGAR